MVTCDSVQVSDQATPKVIRFVSVFALFLERERARSGLTQAEIAKKLSVTFQAVGHWETGARPPSDRNMEALFRALGLTMSAGLRLLQKYAEEIEETGVMARGIRSRLRTVAEPVPGSTRAWRRKGAGVSDDGGAGEAPSGSRSPPKK